MRRLHSFIVGFLVGMLIITGIFSIENLESNPQQQIQMAYEISLENPYFVDSPYNYLTDFEGRNPDGTVNVVIEIPAGTNAKWEVMKPLGTLEWEFKDEKPRIVNYLAYPGNYGMIPQTMLPKDLGGDGDPLDVIVLGPSIPRGAVVSAKVIGALKLLDDGEQDDKLIAVFEETDFYSINSISELNKEFPGVTNIIGTWFTNYKGPGEIQSQGFMENEEALELLEYALDEYQKSYEDALGVEEVEIQ